MIKEKFTPENSVLLLIDHQVGTMGWVRSITFDEVKKNALVLAKSAKVLEIPTVLTSSMEDYAQGPLLEEFKEILPKEFESRVQRIGIVNAMDDEKFENAIKKTGRKKLIIAGVTNDVCVVYPAITAFSQGYDVQVVVDAGGSPTKIADETALRRMEQAGVTLTSTNQLIAELAGNWATEKGGQLIQILMDDVFSKIK
ncbi:TPA: isochorismatase family protein [Bacillus cereus]